MAEFEWDQEPFTVDFDDPADMRAKIQRANDNADKADRVLAEVEPLRAYSAKWRARAKAVESQMPPETIEPQSSGSLSKATPTHRPDPDEGSESTVVSLAVGVVNREMRKIRAKDVVTILQHEGHTFKPDAVRNSLYYAANRAKLIKAAPGRGMYAPLGYTEAALIFGSTDGGEPED
jgi:hypothetical protein